MKLKTSLFIKIINFIKPIIIILDKTNNFIWYNYPFGKKPSGTKELYSSLAEEAKNQIYPEIDEYENEKGISIEKLWLDDLALYTQITIKKSDLCYAHGRILYTALSEYLISKSLDLSNERIIIWETGTARGFSSLCMAKAIDDNKRNGLVITFDLLPHSTKMFWNCINDHINGPQTRKELLHKWKNLCEKYILFHQGDTRLELSKVHSDRIHFAFLDGAHSYKDVMYEFNQIKNKQFKGDMIIYDDYNDKKFPGIVRAVNEICKKYNYYMKVITSSKDRGYVLAVKN